MNSQKPQKYFRGDRVTRLVYFDDGTWDREGDSCLDRSPVKHGIVIHSAQDLNLQSGNGEWITTVAWDNGKIEGGFLDHGLDKEFFTKKQRQF